MKPGSRRTLGLLVDWLEDEYQNVVLGGVADAARDHGAHLICFAGGILGAPYPLGAQRNIVYDLAHPENVDALVVMSGAMGNYIGPAALSRYCERYRPLPMCSIAVALDGIPSVLVDNDKGMREAFIHLIEVHGYRRIAFIRGPLANAEAERRYGAYRDVLSEYDLTLDPDLVFAGNFQRSAGAEAVRVLVGERRLKPDVIVAASDAMALGAIEALLQRGIGVPDGIAVVGFDDIAEARFAVPPLTTVRQPLYEQGRVAAEMVLRQLQGETISDRVILPTELVIRRSCRCFSRTVLYEPAYRIAGAAEPFESALQMQREKMLADMTDALREPFADVDPGWGQTLLDTFLPDLQGAFKGNFLVAFDEILKKALAAGRDISVWQGMISVLRSHVLACMTGEHDAVLRSRAEALLHEARIWTANAQECAQAAQKLQVQRWARKLSATGEALIMSFDLTSLVNVAAEQFPRLDIPSCYLSLYDTEAPRDTSRLILAYDTAAGLLRTDGEPFPRRLIAPASIWASDRRATFVLEPLFLGEDQFGVVLLEMGPREGMIYEALRDQISASLKGTLLVGQRQRLLSELEAQSREIEQIQRALQENDESAVASGSPVPLHKLTETTGHEIQTHLATVQAVLADLRDLMHKLQSCAGDSEPTEEYRTVADRIGQAIELLSAGAERAAKRCI